MLKPQSVFFPSFFGCMTIYRKYQIILSLLRDCGLRDCVPVLRKIRAVHMYLARAGSRAFEGRYWRVTHPWERRGDGDMSCTHSHWRDVDVGNFCA